MQNFIRRIPKKISGVRHTFDSPKSKVNWDLIYEKIKEGQRGTIDQISKSMNIKYSTLYARYQAFKHGNPKGNTSNEKRQIANRIRCGRLSIEQEQQFVKIINQKILDNLIVSPDAIRNLANQMFIRPNEKNLSVQWPYRFMKRNGFVFRKSKLINRWNSSFTPKQLAESFWEECHNTRKIKMDKRSFKIDHSLIFNVNETNLQFISPIKSITKKGRNENPIHLHNTKQTITLIAGIAGDGTKLPPTFIIKIQSGKRVIPALQKKYPNSYFFRSLILVLC